MRAVIYCRVSSDDQSDNFSLPSQEARCRQYAEQQRLEVCAVITDVISGAVLDRPGLSKVRELVRTRAIDAVIIYSLDRLTRSIAHSMLMRDEMKTAGVILYTVSYGIGQDTLEHGLMETIEAAFAEYERIKLRERIQRGMHHRLESNLGHGNKLPFGYRYTNENRREIEIDKEEATVVRMIYDWYTEGMGSLQIVARLSEKRILTPSDRRFYINKLKRRQPGEWSVNTVGAILRNPIYKGELICHQGADSFTYQVPPIIDPAHWDVVAHLREKRYSRVVIGRRNNSKFYMLKGHVKCGVCGCACAGSQGGRGIHHYYRCHRIRTTHTSYPPRCNLPQFPLQLLDNAVWNWLDTKVLDERHIRSAVEDRDDQSEAKLAQAEAERSIICRQLENLEVQATKLIELYTAGLFSIEEIAAQKNHIDQAHASCKETLTQMNQQLTSIKTIPQRTNELRSLIMNVRETRGSFTPEEKVRIIDLLDIEVTLSYEGEAGRGKRPARFADIVCRFTLDSTRLEIAGVSMETTMTF